MAKPILLIDFDGTIHSYTTKWEAASIIPDPPVPGALEWLVKAVEHFNVQIFSSRNTQPGGVVAMVLWLSNHGLDQDVLKKLSFPSHKPSGYHLLIDDKAMTFRGDWEAYQPETLLKFKPWNKR